MRPRVSFLVLLILSVGAAMPVEAEDVTHLAQAPELIVPRTELTPRLDAAAEDPAWTNAAVIVLGNPGEPSSAELRMLWSPEALWVRCRSDDPDLQLPFANQRDAEHYRGDVVEVFLDPVGDGRCWYEVQATPGGGVTDLVHLLTAAPRSDARGLLLPEVRDRDLWRDTAFTIEGLRSRGAVLPGEDGRPVGWIVDLAIPASVLRRTGAEAFAPGMLRANLLRYDWLGGGTKPTPRFLAWAPVVPGCPHISPLAMGVLRLVDAPAPVPVSGVSR